jgi:hypothetical protein
MQLLGVRVAAQQRRQQSAWLHMLQLQTQNPWSRMQLLRLRVGQQVMQSRAWHLHQLMHQMQPLPPWSSMQLLGVGAQGQQPQLVSSQAGLETPRGPKAAWSLLL